ncbi:hypothetical protein SDC9_140889 [bioreactor metagenome]|uniref:Uncharacterized protein n=1 Tax=bioreactor metagenome TaxID=1076179 RepID=A0A645DWJ1_9ZZZZ
MAGVERAHAFGSDMAVAPDDIAVAVVPEVGGAAGLVRPLGAVGQDFAIHVGRIAGDLVGGGRLAAAGAVAEHDGIGQLRHAGARQMRRVVTAEPFAVVAVAAAVIALGKIGNLLERSGADHDAGGVAVILTQQRTGGDVVAAALAHAEPVVAELHFAGTGGGGIGDAVLPVRIGIEIARQSDLLQVRDAGRRFGALSRRTQRRQQHRRQNGDDRDHDKEFNERKNPVHNITFVIFVITADQNQPDRSKSEK